MSFRTFWLLGLLGVSTAKSQNVPPPQFAPYTGPTIAYPETQIGFTLLARSFQTSSIAPRITYDLIAGPTNVTLDTISGRPPDEEFALLRWQIPAHATIGTSNVFILRATDGGIPPLSATNTINFVLVDLPSIHSIVISKGAPTLQFSNAIPVQAFLVLWSADLSATNWWPLCQVSSDASLVTVTDTNVLMRGRFYKLMPQGGWCYGFCP